MMITLRQLKSQRWTNRQLFVAISLDKMHLVFYKSIKQSSQGRPCQQDLRVDSSNECYIHPAQWRRDHHVDVKGLWECGLVKLLQSNVWSRGCILPHSGRDHCGERTHVQLVSDCGADIHQQLTKCRGPISTRVFLKGPPVLAELVSLSMAWGVYRPS